VQVSLNWLKEYVDIDISPEKLADRLTNAGIAVEHVEYLNKGIENVVVAQVLEANKHPNAEKLSLCQVTTDGVNRFQVVCGAPNVRAGQKVPFAMVGAVLPGNFKIKKAKLRGTESQGMICSAQELGLNEENLTPEQKEGILVLDGNISLGKNIIDVLGLDDCILHFDLTPNLSHCLSVINIAREIAAICDKEIKLPEVKLVETDESIDNIAEIEVDAPEFCPRYVARVVKGVEIKPSPQWLQHKLRCAGIRPINNIVDITNYVLLEMGQPLHAFDFKYLTEGKIIVRKAYQQEKIKTLDEVERELTEEMLLITDPTKPVAIAGVMGGANSEVTAETTTILIESAYFNPTSIRRTSTTLGLRSEASIRFEKGINIETVVDAANRAAQLIQDLAGGRILKGVIDNYSCPQERTVIELEMEKVDKVLGTNIDNKQIKNLLKGLNFKIINENQGSITVEVPPYRPDVTIAEDLIEEVARIYGYNNIPTTLPYGATSKGQKTDEQRLRDKIINTLAARGLNEIINFSFINKENFDKLLFPAEDVRRKAIPVLNPLSEEQGIMRTSLLPGMLEALRRNVNRRNENLGLFELGKIYLPQGFPAIKELPVEKWTLGLALRGNLASDWQEKGKTVDFYYLKGIVENLLTKLKINNVSFKSCQDNPSYHPGRTASIFIENQLLGIPGELHPEVAENYDLTGRNYVAELDVELLLNIAGARAVFKQLPKFPAVSRDLAVVVNEEIFAADILKTIKEQGGVLLVDTEIFDVYKGNQIPEGHKSIAFALTFQAKDRTLTDKEINEVYDKIYKTLTEKYSAILRA